MATKKRNSDKLRTPMNSECFREQVASGKTQKIHAKSLPAKHAKHAKKQE